MAQEYDGHLTTEQLSAYLDKQLSMQERLEWNAHLRVCQQCQRRLADLRQTVVLLRALPQAELPRSFVLPASTKPAPERHLQPVRKEAVGSEYEERVTPIAHARPRKRSVLQRSMRVLSTIAAVIGFILIASGFLLGAHIGGGSSATPVAAPSTANHSINNSGATPPRTKLPSQAANGTSTGSGATTPQVTRTPIETVRPAPTTVPAQDQNLSLPPVFDLSTPVGLEGVGVILLVLGFLGLMVMRIARRRELRT